MHSPTLAQSAATLRCSIIDYASNTSGRKRPTHIRLIGCVSTSICLIAVTSTGLMHTHFTMITGARSTHHTGFLSRRVGYDPPVWLQTLQYSMAWVPLPYFVRLRLETDTAADLNPKQAKQRSDIIFSWYQELLQAIEVMLHSLAWQYQGSCFLQLPWLQIVLLCIKTNKKWSWWTKERGKLLGLVLKKLQGISYTELVSWLSHCIWAYIRISEQCRTGTKGNSFKKII